MIGFVIISPDDFNILALNDYLAQLTGVSAQQAQGKPLLEVFPALKQQGLETAFQHVQESGAPVTLSRLLHPTIFPAADGRVIPQVGYIEPTFRNNELASLTLYVVDVSDRQLVEDELRKRIRHAEALYEINRYALQGDLKQALQTTVHYARLVFGGLCAVIHLVQGSEWQLVADDCAIPLEKPPAENVLWQKAAQEKKAQRALSIKEAGYNTLHPLARCAISSPLMRQEDILGALTVETESPAPLLGDALIRLQALADSLANALYQAQLREAEQQRLAELDAVFHATTALRRASDSQQIFNVLVEQSREALQAETAFILMPDKNCNCLKVVSAINLPDEMRRVTIALENTLSGGVFRLGQPLLIPDLEEVVLPMSQRLDMRNVPLPKAAALAPLKAGEETIGVFFVARRNAFSAQDIRLLTTLADIGGSAIQRQQLHEQATRRARRMTLLHRISQRLAPLLDEQELYQETVEALVEHFGYYRASVTVPTPDGQHLRLAAQKGGEEVAPPTGTLIPIAQALCQPAIAERKAFANNHAPYSTVKDTGPGSFLCAPVLREDQLQAMVSVTQPHPDAFDQGDVSMLETLTAYLGAMLQSIQQYRRLQKSAERLRLLNEANQRLVDQRHLEAVLQITFEAVFQLLEARSGGAFRLNGDKLEPLFLAGLSPEAETALRARPPTLRDGLFRQVVEEQLVVEIADISRDERVAKLEGYTGSALWSAPVVVNGKTMAVFDFDALPADEETRALLNSLLDRAGTALENALLYEEVVRLSQHRAALLDFSTLLATVVELDDALSKAVVHIRQTIGADVCSVMLFEKDAEKLAVRVLDVAAGKQALEKVGQVVEVKQFAYTQQALIERRLQYIPNPADDPKITPGTRRWAKENRLTCLALVPMLFGEQITGIITLYNLGNGRHFSENTLSLAQGLANQLALAVLRAQYHETVRQHALLLEERVEERTRELKMERNRLEAILQSAGEGVIVTDIEGTIEYVNPAFERITGYTQKELLGKNPRLFKSGRMPQQVYEHLWQTILSGETWHSEIINRHKDGTLYDALLTITPLYDARGKIGGFVGVMQDVSPLKEAQRMKAQFVSNVSHELRTPITSLQLYLERLHDAPPAQQQRYLEVLMRETNRLQILVDDLLTLSRLDVGKATMQLMPINLNVLLHQLVEDRQVLAEQRQLRLIFQPAQETVMALADPKFVTQIATNLITNALNYCSPGCTVHVRLEMAEEIARFGVLDDGPGIPLHEQAHLFERFYRGSSPHVQRVAGTGLGLAIVKELVERLNGQVTLTSAPGAGTQVWVQLPVPREEQTSS